MNKQTVGDWIEFISAEKHGNTNSVIGFQAILLTVVVAIFANKESVSTIISNAVFVFVLLVFFKITVFRPFQKYTQNATRLLNKIMRDGLGNTEEIRQKWNEYTRHKKS